MLVLLDQVVQSLFFLMLWLILRGIFTNKCMMYTKALCPGSCLGVGRGVEVSPGPPCAQLSGAGRAGGEAQELRHPGVAAPKGSVATKGTAFPPGGRCVWGGTSLMKKRVRRVLEAAALGQLAALE